MRREVVAASEVVVRLLPAAAKEQKPQLSVEGQVDPWVHYTVESEEPEQPDDRICWKSENSIESKSWCLASFWCCVNLSKTNASKLVITSPVDLGKPNITKPILSYAVNALG